MGWKQEEPYSPPLRSDPLPQLEAPPPKEQALLPGNVAGCFGILVAGSSRQEEQSLTRQQ